MTKSNAGGRDTDEMADRTLETRPAILMTGGW
jgi:hypothetical protein